MKWELQSKGAASSLRIPQENLTSQQKSILFSYAQAKSKVFFVCSGFVAPVKLLENLLFILSQNSRTMIYYLKVYRIFVYLFF